MKTRGTTHLGDGVYAGVDMSNPMQIWLGANHHENMTIALGPGEVAFMVVWLKQYAPHFAKEAGLL